ncbi:surface antigen negative regulator Par [Streptococcus criceti]|uniref:Surface antigen negative regulator Par n=2 Tax=Streptococcus criceti TaxID=1333 RepID=G5JRZ7_STRCG|nr:DUF3267 domain-containing protein [Streptococcus criceti]EHI75005.1 hypothetical protein STRCR_2076 [Streptococcus criceti HS-6]BAB59133.1 probable surface antigen negative regulator Par [Streptococcus criceti]SUN42844.1 surface antigen negative regulator Par [Streptococcus criceti]
MKLIADLNILKRKGLIIGLKLLSLLLCFPYYYLFSRLAIAITGTSSFYINWWEPFFFLFDLVLLLVIHEGIHAFYLKLFNPNNPVKYGSKWYLGFFNAASPGSYYPKGQMLIVYLAPFVLTSLVLTLVLALGWLSSLTYLVLSVLHTAACTKDFYFVYLIFWKYRKYQLLIEIKELIIKFYQA